MLGEDLLLEDDEKEHLTIQETIKYNEQPINPFLGHNRHTKNGSIITSMTHRKEESTMCKIHKLFYPGSTSSSQSFLDFPICRKEIDVLKKLPKVDKYQIIWLSKRIEGYKSKEEWL